MELAVPPGLSHDVKEDAMYYSSGNYEAFARPRKPEGIDDKSAYIVGTGLAGLSAACFLVRDAQMPGSQFVLPINVVTSLFGAPFVLWIVLKRKRGATSFNV